MTIAKRINFNSGSVGNEVVILDGGMNEAVSSLEMKSGELIYCKNYYITEGSTGGYVSLPGYERYDGHPAPSSIDLDEGDLDTSREAARTAILEVPGINTTRGCIMFKGKLYAFRDKVGGLSAGMYVESPAGWVEIDTAANPLEPGGDYQFLIYNFLATEAGERLFFTNGVNKARAFDGTTVTVINNAGMGADDKPQYLAAHNDRLWLTYPGGSLQYSVAGMDFDEDGILGEDNDWLGVNGAGEIGVGGDITAIVETVGNVLVIFGRDFIKTLEGALPAEWVLKSFSDAVGAYPNTVAKLFDTLIFMSDMGVTTLTAAQEFGNFISGSISEKVKKTLITNKEKITCATTVKSLNQYRIYFNTGFGMIFSFFNKKLRGVTFIQYPIPVYVACDVINATNTPTNFFTSTGGYVFHMDSGTSFDGTIIESRFSTTYYHYKSPRNWKRFLMFTFEISCKDTTTFSIKRAFDYGASGIPKTIERSFDASGTGALWGEGEWGTMIWVGADTTNRITYPTQGLGSNMNITIRTSSKFNRQHTFQNFITDFIILGRQL